MYKLIIGNVRISVLEDEIKRDQATAAAKKVIAAAGQQGKVLSLVEISSGPNGLEVKTTEKAGSKVARKSLKQSMMDGIYIAAKEKLYPNNAFTQRDSWYDSDTGQEWYGAEVETARQEVLEKLADWAKNG